MDREMADRLCPGAAGDRETWQSGVERDAEAAAHTDNLVPVARASRSGLRRDVGLLRRYAAVLRGELHTYLLHAPDFLGFASGIEMAAARRDVVERGLALKKAGNAIMEAVGGRAPARAELAVLTEPLNRALDIALETVRWVAGFEFPGHHVDADLPAALRLPCSCPRSCCWLAVAC